MRMSRWHLRCGFMSVTMKHIAAVVLLLAMASAPITTLTCVGWCVSDAVPVKASCHHHGSGAGANVTGAEDACARLLATSPYVREEPQLLGPTTSSGIADAGSVARGQALLMSGYEPARVLPRHAASSLILRL
jgi:hypothetical protein